MLLCPSLQYPFSSTINLHSYSTSFFTALLLKQPSFSPQQFSSFPSHLLDCHFFFLYRYQYLPPSSIMFPSLSNSFDIEKNKLLTLADAVVCIRTPFPIKKCRFTRHYLPIYNHKCPHNALLFTFQTLFRTERCVWNCYFVG